MGWFLRSRLVTHLSVLVGLLLATLSTFYYAWSISRSWPSPTNFTKVIRVFAMIFHALFATQSILTWHSLFVASRSMSSGLWITFGIASIVFDFWWFTLMASRRGFGHLCGDDGGSCSRKGISIAFCVFLGFYALFRLIIMLFVFHFNVHYNETAGLPAPAPVQQPMMAAYPYAQPAVAKLQSLAKRWMPARSGGSGGWSGRWGGRSGARGGGAGGAGNVPLISVSQHDDSLPVHSDALPAEEGVLFDADEGQARRRSSSLSESCAEEGLEESDGEEQQLYEERRKERRKERKGKYQQV
ncbi:hypothetical protein JCM10296v2_003869 [Rhodotorula toruloides]